MMGFDGKAEAAQFCFDKFKVGYFCSVPVCRVPGPLYMHYYLYVYYIADIISILIGIPNGNIS